MLSIDKHNILSQISQSIIPLAFSFNSFPFQIEPTSENEPEPLSEQPIISSDSRHTRESITPTTPHKPAAEHEPDIPPQVSHFVRTLNIHIHNHQAKYKRIQSHTRNIIK
jgi:hypothetical protein